MRTRIVLMVALAIGPGTGLIRPSRAANFIVNDSAGGAFDAVPGDGVCEHTHGLGDCSVQAAVQESNALLGTDTIALPAGTFPADPFLDVLDATIVAGAGAASTSILGNGIDTCLRFSVGVDVTLVGVTVTGGHGGNVGGGITLDGGGQLTLIDCVVRDNTTVNVGGGVNVDAGHLLMVGTTVSGNVAGNVGGGVYVSGFASAAIVNSTVSGNRAGNVGGGIANEGYTVLNNVTVVNNTAFNTGAGISSHQGEGGSATLIMSNVIAANNGTPFRGQEDCIDEVTTHGYNLIEAPQCTIAGSGVGTDVLGQDPALGPLTNNGGPTPTHALSATSPAVNAGNPKLPGSGAGACAGTDQRGIARPSGIRCDIGAFELARCGDGILDPEEECDDGSNVDGDGCDSNCTVTRCGNGVVSAPEECDDANTLDGDCCSSTCTLEPIGPFAQPLAGAARFSLKRDGKLSFKWAGGPAAKTVFGDPTSGTAVSVCLLDTTGATPTLVASARVGAGAGWRARPDGYAYARASAAPGTFAKLKLQGGSVARIAAKGLAPRLKPGRLPLVTPVTVLLRTSTGTAVFGAGFGGPKINRMDGFQARSQ